MMTTTTFNTEYESPTTEQDLWGGGGGGVQC